MARFYVNVYIAFEDASSTERFLSEVLKIVSTIKAVYQKLYRSQTSVEVICVSAFFEDLVVAELFVSIISEASIKYVSSKFVTFTRRLARLGRSASVS